MTEPLPEKAVDQLRQALGFISQTVHDRLAPMAASRSLGDQYECVNAVVYLMSSAASLPYVGRQARLRSFDSWPSRGCQSPQDLVESGFFYQGDGDHVKCFFCDLGLRDWNPADVPALEHAKFSPLCFYLKASRGLDWLRQQSARPPNYPASYLRQDHNELMKLMKFEFQRPYVTATCGVGFDDTRVLLCISRRFIRQRTKFSLPELVQELQTDLDREMLQGNAAETRFPGQFDLAGALTALRV